MSKTKTTCTTEVRGELTPADLDLIVGGRVMCEGDTGAAGRTSSSGNTGCSPLVTGPHCPGYR
jgi:hypothetical protein